MGNSASQLLRTISPFLADQANNIFGVEDNIKALNDDFEKLEARSLDVQTEVDIQQRQGLKPLQEVQLWLSRVEIIKLKVRPMLEGSSVQIQRLRMYGLCFNDFSFTYSYGKEVSKELKNVELLLSSSPSPVVATRGLPSPMEAGSSSQSTIGLKEMLRKTWELLKKDEVGILGLYGTGGIGKTTLLNEINNQFLEDGFSVIWVEVSQNLNIERIQKEIGKELGLAVENKEWELKTKRQKAFAISNVLTRKRFAMLLDDIWSKVDLQGIGITSTSIVENKSKVVFTTRSLNVCGRMAADAKLEVKSLDQEEAWELFKQKVGARTLKSHRKILELARTVCEKCEGLPLAITVIGETMACKTTVDEWENAINVLNSNAAAYTEVEDEVLKVLKISYDYLRDEKVKQCFQYCALFPKDGPFSKSMLVNYWICEGIIKNIDQGYGIISTLVEVSLLTNCEDGERVKMHDVIRQMALWIASDCGTQEENFVVKTGDGALSEMPKVEDWNAVSRMSLENNEIQKISVAPLCSNLKTLILRNNKLVKISGSFFLSMPKLLVLDLSGNEQLCELPEEISKLVSLRYLDLSETKINSLPAGLIFLVQLRYLDMTGVVVTRPSISVISSLHNLETLYLCKSTCLSLELIKDIESMQYLKALSVSINDFVVLERLLSITKLAQCIQGLSLVEVEATSISFATATASIRNLLIEDCRILSIMEHTSHISFQNLNYVKLKGVMGIQDLTWLSFAPNLTSLFVVGPSTELKEIISKKKVSGTRPFAKLHTLYLRGLVNLESIYWESLDFKDLVMIMITICPKLRELPLNVGSGKENHIRALICRHKRMVGQS